MASNLYPQSMSLHTIGYAALKYPELPPELPIPFGNQLGVMQRTPLSSQIRSMSQIASQYLPALLEYQYSDNPLLRDPKSSQYYCSDAFLLVNWLTSNPDVATRVAKHPQLAHDIIERLLNPTIEADMKACTWSSGTTWDAGLGSMLQFVSTILLWHDSQEPVHPRIKELVPKFKAWNRTYREKFISKVSDRLADQIASPEALDLGMVKASQKEHLVCGYILCGNKKDMNACGQCRIQRYCSTDHQKKDWKNHKKICCKGLAEE